MNIFIKYNEEKNNNKLISINNKNITIFELIENIKKEIIKDEKKFKNKNFDIKLFFQKIELKSEKKLNEYDLKNNDELMVEIILKKEKKKNFVLIDLKIFFFENKKFFETENNFNKNLILKLKNNFFEKKNLFKKDFIGCGLSFSWIYNNSFLKIFF
jgi:hypothetical protein